MPFPRPTLSNLRAQVGQDISATVSGGSALLRRAVLRVLGDVQAGLAHLHYGYLDWIARQAVPFTCTDEFLEGWAALKGVTRKSAEMAKGSVTFSGEPGTILPSGAAVVRADGVSYTTRDTMAVGANRTVTAAVMANDPGVGGNADAGVAMALSPAVAGIQSPGVAATDLIGGADAESDDDLRTRMLAAYRVTAQGGDAEDYVAWALEVPGVTRAWCARNGAGIGTVVVYVMLDDAQATHSGFPQGSDGVATADTRALAATGDQCTVADHLWNLQPVTALVYVVSPIPTPVEITIKGVPIDGRAAATAALIEQFRQDGEPGGTIKIHRLWAALEIVPGLKEFDIESPIDNIESPTGHLLTVGPIFWK